MADGLRPSERGKFACYNVVTTARSDGSSTSQASCSDVSGCDIDGDGNMEFIFSTSHGTLCAVGDDGGKPRPKLSGRLRQALRLGPPLLADMDGDGKTDIVVAGEDVSRVRVFGAGRYLFLFSRGPRKSISVVQPLFRSR